MYTSMSYTYLFFELEHVDWARRYATLTILYNVLEEVIIFETRQFVSCMSLFQIWIFIMLYLFNYYLYQIFCICNFLLLCCVGYTSISCPFVIVMFVLISLASYEPPNEGYTSISCPFVIGMFVLVSLASYGSPDEGPHYHTQEVYKSTCRGSMRWP